MEPSYSFVCGFGVFVVPNSFQESYAKKNFETGSWVKEGFRYNLNYISIEPYFQTFRGRRF